ncbi:unnamed protein product [Heligmosomoides polygyrus]|uniref:Mariner Mos1 transposase n=1 Tax=Heligmosomoides polygyrus TaxID=6339 RepID=A0A183G2P8_HELPZ|nr:unnamed protein product [Heligmosomoides polygyrus]
MQTFNFTEELHSIAPGYKTTKQGKIVSMYDICLARRYLNKAGHLTQSRKEVFEVKAAAREGECRAHFLSDTSPQYNMLLTWIDAMVFEDASTYSKFYSLLDRLREEKKVARAQGLGNSSSQVASISIRQRNRHYCHYV